MNGLNEDYHYDEYHKYDYLEKWPVDLQKMVLELHQNSNNFFQNHDDIENHKYDYLKKWPLEDQKRVLESLKNSKIKYQMDSSCANQNCP